MGQPEEVGSLVVFLASDESSFSTGWEFILDGGQTAGITLFAWQKQDASLERSEIGGPEQLESVADGHEIVVRVVAGMPISSPSVPTASPASTITPVLRALRWTPVPWILPARAP